MEKKKSYGVLIVGAILLILGIVLAVITHNNSYQESVAYGSQLSDVKAQLEKVEASIEAVTGGTADGDLDALNADGPEARFGRGQAAHRIGAAGGVLRLQREGTVRCGDDHIGGIALGVGRPDGGETVPRDVHCHPLHRGRLPGRKCLNAQNSGSITKTPLPKCSLGSPIAYSERSGKVQRNVLLSKSPKYVMIKATRESR